MKKNLSKTFAKGTAAVLKQILRMDANSASCLVTYQPKVPKELAEFKKK